MMVSQNVHYKKTQCRIESCTIVEGKKRQFQIILCVHRASHVAWTKLFTPGSPWKVNCIVQGFILKF